MSAFEKARFVTPPMWCSACGKTARGPVQPGWIDIETRNKETDQLEECLAVCSSDCLETWINKETKTMTDPTAVELDILQIAGQAGGEYLDSLGRSDLATLSGDEWMTFIQAVIGKYEDLKIPF